MDQEARIANLEGLVAFQDRTIQELHEVILRHAARLERIEADLRHALEQRDPPLRDAAPEDPPPHY